jgi:uncharacterized Zn ribbon protein
MCNCGSSVKKGFGFKGIRLLTTPKPIPKKINPPRFNHLKLMSFKIK